MTSRNNYRAMADVLLRSFAGRRMQLLRLMTWSVIEAVPAYLSGRLVARAVDHGFLVHRVAAGLAWLSVLGLSVFVGGWATRQLYPNVAGLVEPFRDRLVGLTVSAAIRRSTTAGGRADAQAVARLTRQVEIAREAYASLLVVVQGFVVATVSALLGLATLVPAALVLVLPPLAVSLALFVASLGRLAARQRDSILADEHISQVAVQLIEGRRDIVASGGEEIMESEAGRHIQAQVRATTALARLTAIRNLAVSIGGLLPVVLVLVEAPWLIKHGATTGAVLGILTYLLAGIHPALQTLVRGVGSNGVWMIVSLGRLVEVTDSADRSRAELAIGAPTSFGSSPALRMRPARQPCDAQLSQVTFTYGSAPQPVIRDLDLTLPDGDHLAVVGPSGIGKSTLAGLMSGMLEPQSGTVFLAGKPVESLSVAALTRLRVLVPEEAYVFSGSLRDNLTYLRPSASRRQVDLAVDVLGARKLAERLGGYAAEVDPRQLSAGEHQLIALIRSYLSPGRLVILDEATCHLDPVAEGRVERAFAKRPGALVVIAHRISSALRAKRVLLMDGNHYLLGTHNQLLAGSELYRYLVGCWVGEGYEDWPPTLTTGRIPGAVNGSRKKAGDGSAQTNGRVDHLRSRSVRRAGRVNGTYDFEPGKEVNANAHL